MDRSEIMAVLPHRPPMLLVDEAHIEGDDAVGRYTVRGDEFFLQGHYPGHPIVPGVMLCEMMGQSAAVLFVAELTGQVPGLGRRVPYFAGLDKVKFRHPVVPGDTVVFRLRVVRSHGTFYFLTGSGWVGDDLCVTAELTFALVEAPDA